MLKSLWRFFRTVLISIIGIALLVYNPISARIMTKWTAYKHGFDKVFFYNLISAESSFNSIAYSRKRAIGLGQVRIETARYIYPEYVRGMLWFPPTNLHISAIYLKYLSKRYRDNKSLILAAYNWGETNVDRKLQSEGVVIEKSKDYRELFRNVPETFAYIQKVLD